MQVSAHGKAGFRRDGADDLWSFKTLQGARLLVHFPNRSTKSATSPVVMKIFSPLMTIPSPSGRNFVRMLAASDPACGSVIASAASAPPR